MTETLPVLRELVLLAGLSLLVSLVFGRLRLPAVSGFIVTGALIGPGGLGLIEDPGTIHLLAEIGVVVLLFTIGLEFSLADLRAMGPRTAVAGALQVALTALLVAPALAAAGLHPAQAAFLGCAAAISSTTLILRVVTDRGELQAPHGRLLMGVSLVQDVSLVPLTLLVPVLAGWLGGGAASAPAGDTVLRALFGSAAAGLVVVAAWRWLPWLMGRASRTGSREVFLAGIVAVVLGSAYLSERVGLSLALGAFLAGLMLAGSEVSSQVAADLLPFRDTLSSVFFLSLGMLFSPDAVARHPLLTAAATVGLVAIKLGAGYGASRLAGIVSPVALAAALGVAHVGEFAFVLIQTGTAAGLVPGDWGPVFIAASLFSLLAGPLLAGSASRWSARWHARGGVRATDVAATLAPAPERHPWRHHVVIAGFGLNGRNVARVLRAVKVTHVVVDHGPDKVARCVAQGSPAILGNAAQPEILERAGLAHARVLVVALSDPLATRHVVRLARQSNASLHIVVRTRFVAEVDGFYDVGANVVIPEEFETSIEIFTAVLRQFHVPHNIVDAQVTLLRRERYSVLRGQKLPGTVIEQLDDILAQGTTETARVLQHSPAVGRTLAETGVAPDGPGARCVAVVRAGRAITGLDAAFLVHGGDTLVLLGAHREIDEALERLAPPEPPAATRGRHGWPGEDPEGDA